MCVCVCEIAVTLKNRIGYHMQIDKTRCSFKITNLTMSEHLFSHSKAIKKDKNTKYVELYYPLTGQN